MRRDENRIPLAWVSVYKRLRMFLEVSGRRTGFRSQCRHKAKNILEWSALKAGEF